MATRQAEQSVGPRVGMSQGLDFSVASLPRPVDPVGHARAGASLESGSAGQGVVADVCGKAGSRRYGSLRARRMTPSGDCWT